MTAQRGRLNPKLCEHFKDILKLTLEKCKREESIREEYENLEQVPPAPGQPNNQHDTMVRMGLCQEACKFPYKNRYCNLFPFDECLVRLSGSCHYINASWIRFSGSKDTTYIATMGPMLKTSYTSREKPDSGGAEDTCGDFWEMCWQTNSKIIVMLCVLQPGFTGCSPYFPQDKESDRIVFPPLTVQLIDFDDHTDYSVRKFLISKEKDKREIFHFQFKSWPNYGVPENSGPISEFVHRVYETVESEVIDAEVPKFVVHCSGGIGRSGTFLSAYHSYSLLRKLASKGEPTLSTTPTALSMFDLVWQMRVQRHPWMVEGRKQLTTAYDIIIYLLGKLISDMEV